MRSLRIRSEKTMTLPASRKCCWEIIVLRIINGHFRPGEFEKKKKQEIFVHHLTAKMDLKRDISCLRHGNIPENRIKMPTWNKITRESSCPTPPETGQYDGKGQRYRSNRRWSRSLRDWNLQGRRRRGNRGNGNKISVVLVW